MHKKWFKKLIIFMLISIPIVPVLALIDYSSPSNAIFISGSSSILPLTEKYSKKYDNSEIIPTGGGSGKGLIDAAEGNTDFGAMSSNKKSSIIKDTDIFKQWKKQENKTITIAQDAIVISLHIPPSITSYKTTSVAPSKIKYVNVRPWAIAEMYSVGQTQVKWSDLLEDAQGPGKNMMVKAYGRNGGKAASGTSDGFFHTLKHFASYSNPEIKLDYNHNSSKIIKTPEANSQAYSRLNSGNAYGLTYLSLGYLENILTSNESNNNIQPAFVDVRSGNSATKRTGNSDSSGDAWKIPTIENAKDSSYNWIRPFNLAYSLNDYNKNSYIKDFVKWIFEPKGGQYWAKEMNLVPLAKKQHDDQIKYLKYSDNHLATSSHQVEKNYGYGFQGNKFKTKGITSLKKAQNE